ncbi:MAG: tRNA (guanosine(37)-N1)-methyltransferase TrmD [Candidatus Moraniibacteriota bacterium]
MQFNIVTIFPAIFDAYFRESIIKRALEKKIIKIDIHNLRDYSTDRHQKVDDTPYGGGAGMVLQVEPIFNCIKSIKNKTKKTRIILFSAKGRRYTQNTARRLARYENLIFICGRYEGVDERVAEYIADEEISIGDYVLTGGELPAMILVDSVTRLLPGVLGNEESAKYESHSSPGYKEYPQYSKPQEFNGWNVPDVLLSGNHNEIEKWRSKISDKKLKK